MTDDMDRRRVPIQRNRGEGRHRLARVIFHGQRGELRQRYHEGQEDQLRALGRVVHAIVLGNTVAMDQILTQLHVEGQPTADEDVARLSPRGYDHRNVRGRSRFELPEALGRGDYRPLRTPEAMTRDSDDTR